MRRHRRSSGASEEQLYDFEALSNVFWNCDLKKSAQKDAAENTGAFLSKRINHSRKWHIACSSKLERNYCTVVQRKNETPLFISMQIIVEK